MRIIGSIIDSARRLVGLSEPVRPETDKAPPGPVMQRASSPWGHLGPAALEAIRVAHRTPPNAYGRGDAYPRVANILPPDSRVVTPPRLRVTTVLADTRLRNVVDPWRGLEAALATRADVVLAP